MRLPFASINATASGGTSYIIQVISMLHRQEAPVKEAAEFMKSATAAAKKK